MSTRSILTAALVLIAALFASWFLFSGAEETAVPPLEGRQQVLRWRAGHFQRYSFRIDSEVEIGTHGTKHPEPLTQRVEGLLEFRTLESDTTGARIGMRLHPVTLSIGGVSEPEINRVLSSPFRVHLTKTGLMTKFEFSENLEAQHRALIEELVRTFQVDIRDESTWSSEESHGTGSYVAEYVRADLSRFVKTKLSYQEPTGTPKSVPRMRVLSSAASIALDSNCDWISEMTIDEILAMAESSGVSAEVTTHASLEWLPESTQLTAAPRSLWEFAASEAPTAVREMRRRNVHAGRSTEELAEDLSSSLAALDATNEGRSLLIHKLSDLLLADDELPFLLLGMLETRGLRDRTRADLFYVFERAGTASAQEALCRVISETHWSQRDGNRALIALGGVEEPTPATLEHLWTTSEARISAEASDHANTAALALGSLGNTLFSEEGDGYAELRDGLMNAAWNARDARERSILLVALGNTGDPSLGREVAFFLEDANVSVRRSAAKAQGRLSTDQVAGELMFQLQREKSSSVRASIAGSLTKWKSPTPEAMLTIRESIHSERDNATRYSMARFLGQGLKEFPENRSALEGMLRSEQSKQIRRYLGEALMQS